eukprot:SM000148S01063  [mRNA]  locus=s148:227398:227736:- [translate_table: standard]
MGRPCHTPGGGVARGKHYETWAETRQQFGPVKLRSSLAAAAAAAAAAPSCGACCGESALPACAQEVESLPDGGATWPVFRCAYTLELYCMVGSLLNPTAEFNKDN